MGDRHAHDQVGCVREARTVNTVDVPTAPKQASMECGSCRGGGRRGDPDRHRRPGAGRSRSSSGQGQCLHPDQPGVRHRRLGWPSGYEVDQPLGRRLWPRDNPTPLWTSNQGSNSSTLYTRYDQRQRRAVSRRARGGRVVADRHCLQPDHRLRGDPRRDDGSRHGSSSTKRRSTRQGIPQLADHRVGQGPGAPAHPGPP